MITFLLVVIAFAVAPRFMAALIVRAFWLALAAAFLTAIAFAVMAVVG